MEKRASTLFAGHLKHLRELATKSNLTFSEILRTQIRKPSRNYLADLIKLRDESENRLIETYRVEFYEWLADLLMEFTSTNLEKMAENKARQMASQAGKHAADIRHGKPGGSRDKQEKIRSIWASGKYSSRDICAEQECAGLNMSFSAARKALRNTPNPT